MKLFIITCLLATSATAALEWDQTEVNLQVHAVQLDADAVFRFKNTGRETIALEDVKVTSGSLAPTLEKRAYAPGETGELKVRFDLRGRTGAQKKAVIVQTSAGATARLNIGVDIPKAYSVAPIMMKWAETNAAPTKTAKLVSAAAEPIKLLAAVSSNPAVVVELKTLREGFEYEVVVTRPPAGENLRAVIRIHSEPPPGFTEGKALKFYVHAL